METKEQQNNEEKRKDEKTARLAKENKVNIKGKMEKEAEERDKMSEGNEVVLKEGSHNVETEQERRDGRTNLNIDGADGEGK